MRTPLAGTILDGTTMIVEPDPDAVRATAAASRLRHLCRALASQSFGRNGDTAVAALTAVADMLAETPYPPPAANTDAVVEVITRGLKHLLATP
ncbi:hypothetical protein EON80_23965 [bacterium]|nr:MAG: hypothetical protein EON80_23965 [bacterium]